MRLESTLRILRILAIVFLATGVCAPAYGSPGDLDATFGTGGKVNLGWNGDVDELNAVAFQPDGKIVAAGKSAMAWSSMSVNRYDANGALDTDFSSDGKAYAAPCEDDSHCTAYGVAVLSDGKVVIGGSCLGDNLGKYFMVARFDDSGVPDAEFDSDGVVWTRPGTDDAEGFDMVPVSGNSVVVVGRVKNGTNTDFALARYNADGSLDTGFGSSGYRRTPIGSGASTAYAATVQDDGKIILAGTSVNGDGNGDFTLARYTEDGDPDSGFGTNGVVAHGVGSGDDVIRDVAVDSEGRILVAGYAAASGGNDFALARYLEDGSLDTDFSDDGMAIYSFNDGNDYARGVAVQSDGRIVAAGTATVDGAAVFALVRFEHNGTVDQSFGQSGSVTTSFMGRSDVGNGLGIQSDGKIVVVGSGQDESSHNYLLARYEPGEMLPPDEPEATVPALTPFGIWVCGAFLLGTAAFRMRRACQS